MKPPRKPARFISAGSFLVCLLGLAARAFCAETWYESNSLGTPLREIASGERRGLEYTLKVDIEGAREIRTLFSLEEEGEIRRWERLRSESGFLEEETLYKDRVIDSVTSFYPTGQIKSETLFVDGKEDGHFFFDYAAASGDSSGVPLKVTFSRARTEENGGFRDEYLYLPSGDFHGVKRVYDDGSVYTSIFTSDRGNPREEWHSFGGLEIIFRYDNRGSVLYQEEYRDSVLVERVDFRYDTEAPFRLTEMSAKDADSGGEVLTEYAPDGHPWRETVFENGIRVSLSYFTYKDNLLVRKERRTRLSREEWTYIHDEDENLKQENYLRNGELEMIQFYDPEPDYSRIEEYYREGEVFFRLYIKDGKQVKLEFPGTVPP
ncbi:MAG: hypothetical protein LBD71_02835 [Treponema sp.]|jgi:antitoxin component YwqK of YwqJK toxin-antitoxin module|nr:hypothetical protein [Treponema sp.]